MLTNKTPTGLVRGFGAIGESMGGIRYVSGHPDRPPVRIGISIGDSLAATFACIGALTALHHRHMTGRGQVIDSAIYEAVLNMMESLVTEYDKAGFIRERTEGFHAWRGALATYTLDYAERRTRARIAEIPDGERKLIQVNGVSVAVFHQEGRFYALDNACPHRQGPLIADATGTQGKPARRYLDPCRPKSLPRSLPRRDHRRRLHDHEGHARGRADARALEASDDSRLEIGRAHV